jgi:hypothetical protein
MAKETFLLIRRDEPQAFRKQLARCIIGRCRYVVSTEAVQRTDTTAFLEASDLR